MTTMARAYEERESKRKRPRGRRYEYQPVSMIDSAPLWNSRPCWRLAMEQYARVPETQPCPVCTAAKATHYAVPGDNGNVTLICPAPEDVERLKNVVLAAKSAPSDRDIERLTRGGGVTAKNLILTALKEQALRVAGTPFVAAVSATSSAFDLTQYDVLAWMGPDGGATLRVCTRVDVRVLRGEWFDGVGSAEISRARITDAVASENTALRDLGRLLFDGVRFRFQATVSQDLLTEQDRLRVADSALRVCRKLQNGANVELEKYFFRQRDVEQAKRMSSALVQARASELRGEQAERYKITPEGQRVNRGNVATQFTPNAEFAPSSRQSQYFGEPGMEVRYNPATDEFLERAGQYMAQARPASTRQAPPAPKAPPVVQRKKRGFHFDDD